VTRTVYDWQIAVAGDVGPWYVESAHTYSNPALAESYGKERLQKLGTTYGPENVKLRVRSFPEVK